MASFLGRRYQRKHVSPAEKAIGAFLLILVGAIVVCVVVTARRAAAPLFVVPVEDEAASAPSRAQVLAAQLLPSGSEDGRWRLAGPSVKAETQGAGVSVSAEYEQGGDANRRAAVWIREAPDPSGAQEFFAAHRPPEAEAGEGVPTSAGPHRLGMGRFIAPDRVGFWSGCYYTEVRWSGGAGQDASAYVGLAEALAGRQLAYGPAAEGATGAAGRPASRKAAPQEGESLLPAVAEPLWEGPDHVRVFGPATLYEKIDGRAGLYLAFGFVKLTFGTYRRAGQPGVYVDCYVYDMGELENAFGIFKAEQSSDAEAVAIGREGYGAEGSVFFWKGTCYVQLLAAGSEDVYRDFVGALAQAAARTIADDGRKLWADALLPEKNRVRGSLAFLKRDAFNLEFLGDVYTAEYEADTKRWTLFVHRAASEAAARALVEEYAGYLGKYGEAADRQSDWALGRVGGRYDAVFSRGRYFGGANGCQDQSVAGAEAGALQEAVARLKE